VGSDVADLSQSLIQYLLTPEIQQLLAAEKAWGPTNKNTDLPKELGDALPYGPEKINALNTVDWNIINPAREDWTKRWTREIER
jgi:putative spermidine/putrescine transport system substrate-binding protein